MLNVPSISGSAGAGRSEYGRAKVALKPGKGLMDWVRLASSKLLSRKQPSVDHIELAKHTLVTDCWILLFDTVYDITSYLEFHPGGVDELMRAAGTDATDLFNEYHMWVNYESMLKSCVVGPFRGDRSKLAKPKPAMTEDKTNGGSLEAPTMAQLKISSRILPGSVLKLECPSWENLRTENVCGYIENREFSLLLREYGQKTLRIFWDGLPEAVNASEFTISVVDGAILVDFLDKPTITVFLTKLGRVLPDTSVRYHSCRVDSVEKLNYNCIMMKVSLPSKVVMPVPTGHHVSIRIKKGANLISRPHTPITCVNKSGLYELTFMIKIYRLGILTPVFKDVTAGTCIDISDPIGRIDFERQILAEEAEEVLCFAAGTGITPMIRLAEQRIFHKGKTEIWWFNRTEEDILESRVFPISAERVEHVLSEPTELWTGRKGRINEELVREAVDDKTHYRIYVCGTDGFNNEALRLLREAGVYMDTVHVFQG
uniref:Cytochrome-b5 reductase n=1 Tax=Steinernema glaseri TaxID=37863 RepID=A0A1I8AC15_9BILA